MELRGLGEVELLGIGVGGGHQILELPGEAEGSDGELEELGGAVEVGELEGLGADLAVGIGDLEADLADGGLEGGDAGSDDGEGGFGVLHGGELGEEVVVAGEDLGAELLLEEADPFLELLGSGGGGAGAEGLGGEAGGVEVGGEEGGEDGIGGEGIERRRRRRGRRREVGGAVFEGGEALERGGRDGGAVAVEGGRSRHGFAGNAGRFLVWGVFLGFLREKKERDVWRRGRRNVRVRKDSDLKAFLCSSRSRRDKKGEIQVDFRPFIRSAPQRVGHTLPIDFIMG